MIRLPRLDGPKRPDYSRIESSKKKLVNYLRRPSVERAERRAPIDEEVFYEEDLQQAVRARCRSKCVFCEQRRIDDLVVDHYRPIRDARDLHGVPERDSYASLAYEFDNLVLVCRQCAFNKGTFFPVSGERAPRIASLAEVQRMEKPLLVDPYGARVDRHFDFLCDGWAQPLTEQGRVTLKLLDLNRENLVTARANELAVLLKDLEAAIGLREPRRSVLNLFHPDRPHAGARLNVLRRLLRGSSFQGVPILTAPATVIESFERVLRSDESGAERERLLERLSELPSEDTLVQRRYGDFGPIREAHVPTAGGPWEDVQPSGGITSIRIVNFKGISSLEVAAPLRAKSRSASCLMLLGENAVGKSSILQAVALALLGGTEARKLRLNSSDFLRSRMNDRWDQLTPEDALIELSFQFRSQTACRFDAVKNRVTGDQKLSSIVLGYGPRRYFDRKRPELPRGAYARVKTLFEPTATIPYPGLWLNQLDFHEFAEVAQVIRIVMALDDDDELVRDGDNRICVNLAGRPTPLEWLSEGYKAVFVMIVDIVRELLPKYPILEEAEAIVLIDEIETHLHPRWKMRVVSALRRALPNVQFIVTTHDPLCLLGMDDGEVVVLQRTKNDSIEQLKDLPSIKGMRADQLLTSDFFGLSSTVDPQSELDMAKYVAAIADLPERHESEVNRIIEHITLGDDAQEQVIHRAMKKFIAERDRPLMSLRSDISQEAIISVLAALKE